MLLYIFLILTTFFSLPPQLVTDVLGSRVTPTPTTQQPTATPMPQPSATPKPQPTATPKLQPTIIPTSIPAATNIPTQAVNTTSNNGTTSSSPDTSSTDTSTATDTSTDTGGDTSQDNSSTTDSSSRENEPRISNTTNSFPTPTMFYNSHTPVSFTSLVPSPISAYPSQKIVTPQSSTFLEPASKKAPQDEKIQKAVTPYNLVQIYASFVLSRITNLLSF